MPKIGVFGHFLSDSSLDFLIICMMILGSIWHHFSLMSYLGKILHQDEGRFSDKNKLLMVIFEEIAIKKFLFFNNGRPQTGCQNFNSTQKPNKNSCNVLNLCDKSCREPICLFERKFRIFKFVTETDI